MRLGATTKFELTPGVMTNGSVSVQFAYGRVVTTTYLGLHYYNSYVVFAKILEQRNDWVFYPNFLLDEFFYLLTPYFFHRTLSLHMHFCILFIKILPHLKKNITKSFSDREVLIKVADFVFGYFDLEIFEFVLENTLKTP